VPDLADSLAQFPAEDPQQRPGARIRRPSSFEIDASALLAFTPEAATDDVPRAPRRAYAPPGVVRLRRLYHRIAALGMLAVLVMGVLCRHLLARIARIPRVARTAWSASAITSRNCATRVRGACVACASHAREFSRRAGRIGWRSVLAAVRMGAIGWRGVLAASRIAPPALRRACLVSAWALGRLRDVFREFRGDVHTRPRRERQNPLHEIASPAATFAYPLAFFLSGVVVGAILVTFVSVPPERNVVSASASAPAAPQEILPAQLPPAAVITPAQAAAVPSPDRSMPSIQPVSTTGLDANRPPLPPPAVRAARVESNIGPTLTERASPKSAQSVAPTRPPSRLSAFLGSISVSSTPEGATVFVNGRQVGTTPLLLSDLPVGSRALRLTMPGYDSWTTSVRVVADQRTTVAAALQQSLP
jgi:hypothetical protein